MTAFEILAIYVAVIVLLIAAMAAAQRRSK